MNLTEAMVRIADLEAEKEELINQLGDLTVEKDGYLEELNRIKASSIVHMQHTQDIVDGLLKVTEAERDNHLACMTELFLLDLMTYEELSAFNKGLSALECK